MNSAFAKHELEEMHRAIRNGEVDGFVIGSDSDRRQVLLLSGAHLRYRQLVEDMQQGAVTVSEAGEILFANHSFAAMLGTQPIDLLRTRLQGHVHPDDHAAIAGLLAPRAGQPDVDATLEREDGGTLSARLSFVSAGDGFITLLVTDLRYLAMLAQIAESASALKDLDLPPEARAPLEAIERQAARMRALADGFARLNPKG
jgi:PAS domain S-box-containing protein